MTADAMRQLHDKAMQFAQDAVVARHKGNDDYAKQLFHQAYTCEAAAANLLAPTAENEPSRAILYRSAAWLAVDAGDFRMAVHLAERGLEGAVPDQFRFELSEVLEHARLQFVP